MTIDYNDPTGKNGQLTIDFSVASITRESGQGGVNHVSVGSKETFSQGIVDSIRLFDATGDENGSQYSFTGAKFFQTIPAETPVGNYQLELVITVS